MPLACGAGPRPEPQECLLPRVLQVLCQDYPWLPLLFLLLFLLEICPLLGQPLGFIQNAELMVRVQALLYLYLGT